MASSRAEESSLSWPYTPSSTSNASSIWQVNRQQSQPARDNLFHLDDANHASWRGWHRDATYERPQPEVVDNHQPSPSGYSPSLDSTDTQVVSATLFMGNLEPWMDYEYVAQVIRLMGWDRVTPPKPGTSNSATPSPTITVPVTIKIPPPPQDIYPVPNNPGYCLLTFSNTSHAAGVLVSVSSLQDAIVQNARDSGNGIEGFGGLAGRDSGVGSVMMPNSSRPFLLRWATPTEASLANAMSSINTARFPGQHHRNAPVVTPAPVDSPASLSSLYNQPGQSSFSVPPQQPEDKEKEYSIFVGDLAPETSNSDLVAVFSNPLLGLRNDREPKIIRPFYSCKSAKIMLDPVTGVSRGYGFVRFADEADQQRALIEMHGLYCLSRPMRVSPATAKFKPNAPTVPNIVNQPSIPLTVLPPAYDDASCYRTGGIKSVSSLIAAASNPPPYGSICANTNPETKLLSSKEKVDGRQDAQQMSPHLIAQIKQIADTPQGFSGSASSFTSQGLAGGPLPYGATKSTSPGLYDEAWSHQAQARAILGNLIGPNGEQLTSTDPYNTTVFVGGLSPLISEETLKTFFVPFGEIHYVKVPTGKHCGFVQFVRKGDAERAIENMQGFPIGGSKIRLSWGRSQYKAAQAAAQAAQAAQAEQTGRLVSALLSGKSPASLQLSQEQAIRILQTLGCSTESNAVSQPTIPSIPYQNNGYSSNGTGTPDLPTSFGRAQGEQAQARSTFSPFASSAIPNGQINYTGTGTENVTQQQQNAVLQAPFPSRGFNSNVSPVGMKFNENGASHSLTGSSIASGMSSTSLANPTPAYSTKPPYYHQFKAEELPRNDSQSLFSRIPLSSPSNHQAFTSRTTPSSYQQQHSAGHQQRQGFMSKDDGNAIDLYQDLNGSFSNLDLGQERYSRVAIGSEILSAKETFGEHRRPQPQFSSSMQSSSNENSS